jgi:hypothetical protein
MIGKPVGGRGAKQGFRTSHRARSTQFADALLYGLPDPFSRLVYKTRLVPAIERNVPKDLKKGLEWYILDRILLRRYVVTGVLGLDGTVELTKLWCRTRCRLMRKWSS